MIVDIRPEYDSYIRDMWKNLLDENTNLMAFGGQLEDIYNNISLCSIQFLRAKLETIEEQNG